MRDAVVRTWCACLYLWWYSTALGTKISSTISRYYTRSGITWPMFWRMKIIYIYIYIYMLQKKCAPEMGIQLSIRLFTSDGPSESYCTLGQCGGRYGWQWTAAIAHSCYTERPKVDRVMTWTMRTRDANEHGHGIMLSIDISLHIDCIVVYKIKIYCKWCKSICGIELPSSII